MEKCTFRGKRQCSADGGLTLAAAGSRARDAGECGVIGIVSPTRSACRPMCSRDENCMSGVGGGGGRVDTDRGAMRLAFRQGAVKHARPMCPEWYGLVLLTPALGDPLACRLRQRAFGHPFDES